MKPGVMMHEEKTGAPFAVKVGGYPFLPTNSHRLNIHPSASLTHHSAVCLPRSIVHDSLQNTDYTSL